MNFNFFLLFLFFILPSVRSFGAENVELKDCRSLPSVQAILEVSSETEIIKNISLEEDPILQFMIALNQLLLVEKARRDCSDQAFLNIGFVNKSGRLYESGIAPEAISDPADRKAYEKLRDQNFKNSAVVQEIFKIRNAILDIMRRNIRRMDEAQKNRATEIMHTVIDRVEGP